jgi:hypothetical protein
MLYQSPKQKINRISRQSTDRILEHKISMGKRGENSSSLPRLFQGSILKTQSSSGNSPRKEYKKDLAVE